MGEGSAKRRLKVLVVEDDGLVALMLKEVLLEAGHTVVGPFRTAKPALRALLRRGVDLAILDVFTGRTDVFSLVARLDKKGIPFVFASGAPRRLIAVEHRHRPFLSKPFGVAELLAMVEELADTIPSGALETVGQAKAVGRDSSGTTIETRRA